MIYYVGAYRTEHIAERDPQGSSAEDYKMSYIIATLKKMGYNVTVISVLASMKQGFHPQKICKIDDQETHVYLKSYDTGRLLMCSFAALLRLVGLFIYLVRHITKEDTLLVYHSQLFSIPVRMAKLLRHFCLVLEMEEVFYKEARAEKDVRREPIEKSLISAADKYLAINDVVKAKYCNTKPAVLSYGAYFVPQKYVNRYDDGRTHLVYAGVVNSTHGAHQAVDLMQYLDDTYFLHIYGFGLEHDIEVLNDKIESMNKAIGQQRVCFHGRKSGREFDECLQRCHIGLNFNISLHPNSGEYAFPSKIPSYLGHGLNVLTYRIPSVVQSIFSSSIQFYGSDNPADIATVIYGMEIHDYQEQIQVIKNIDAVFFNEFKELLECQ